MKNDSKEALRILIVDNNLYSRQTAAALLDVEGYQLLQAESGQQGIEIVRTQNPDIVLLDIMLHDIDGYEVCRHLKLDDRTRFIPIIFVTALYDRSVRLKAIEAGGDDFVNKPFDQVELSARVKSLVRQKRLNETLDHTEKALFSIARAVERRDPSTGNHCERLANYGQAFGEFLGLSRLEIRDLSWGGYLHDIGKVGIPDAILLKSGRLTPQEWEVMKQHVLIGEEVCQPLKTMDGVIPIVRSHHERWDGSGYPDQLIGEQIPYLAQAFQLIDIFDALVSERPYKAALTTLEALAVIDAEVFKGWRNPKLVKDFRRFIAQTKIEQWY